MDVDPDKLQIVYYPDPVLHRPAAPLDQVSGRVRAVARRMLELMHAASGVGLAAPQVGLAWRLFVANPTGDARDDRAFVNPRLSDAARQLTDLEEGCLSLPEIRGMIRRPSAITIAALDEQGQALQMRSDGFASRIWQHEVDHLNGVLIIQRMTPMDRTVNRRKLKELESAHRRP